MRQLSFKQYIESKEKLRETITKAPIVEIHYLMKKYCKFPIGSKEDKEFVSLKPNDSVAVTWRYTGTKSRLAEHISFKDEQDGIFTYWRQEKIQSWIEQNCIEMVD